MYSYNKYTHIKYVPIFIFAIQEWTFYHKMLYSLHRRDIIQVTWQPDHKLCCEFK